MTEQWWKDSVVYQVYPKSFYDHNQDGIGDIPGIIHKLDYIQELGIDTIWLSPVYKSPMDDNGYDISDYCDIAEEFGTMEDMKRLIQEAKKRDIKLIMDLVVNHTSDEHPWFEASKSSKDHPMRDWYIWRTEEETNNLRAIFGGSCWEYDEASNEYYFHTFSKKQPDLNWENQDVRQAIYDMINWWMEQGISGFRVDAITFIKKPTTFVYLPPDGVDGRAIVKPNHPGIEIFLQEMKEQSFERWQAMTVAEAPGVATEDLAEFAGDDGFFSMLITFDHIDLDLGPEGKWYHPKPWTIKDFKEAIDRTQTQGGEASWTALYLENHDQPRSLNKFIAPENQTDMSAKLLATTYFFLRGTPFIYQGQELGMRNVSYEGIEHYNDLSTIDQYKAAIAHGVSAEDAYTLVTRRSRDNARTPMQWTGAAHGGFSTSPPWLAANSDIAEINVEVAQADQESVYHYYKELIALRKHPELRDVVTKGAYVQVEVPHEEVVAYKRVYEDKTLLVVGNFSDETVEWQEELQVKGSVIGNYRDTRTKDGRLCIRPFEAVVLVIS